MNFERWSIWKANLDPIIGSEQGKTRPVLIISDSKINKILPVVNILPITSRKNKRRVYPNETLISESKFGLEKESIVLCYPIRTIDKQRLIQNYGIIDDNLKQSEIIDALTFQLGIAK